MIVWLAPNTDGERYHTDPECGKLETGRVPIEFDSLEEFEECSFCQGEIEPNRENSRRGLAGKLARGEIEL